MSKVLTIVERAYHGTLEEQDDTILWMAAAVRNAGGDVDVLLRGNAVNYAVNGQDASGLSIGGVPLKVPPTIDRDVEDLAKKGMKVYAVAEDLRARGIEKQRLVSGVEVVPQGRLASLWDSYDAIWHW